MKKETILITNGHLKTGGVEKSLITLLENLDYDRFEVTLLLFEGLGEYADLIPEQVHVILWDMTETYGSLAQVFKNSITNKNPGLFFTRLILTFARKIDYRLLILLKLFKIAQTKYDYTFAYRVGMPADFVAYSVSARKKYVWWHNGQFNYPNNLIRHWGEIFSHVDGIICVSTAVKQMIEPVYPALSEKMTVIPNMIDVEEIKQKANFFHPYTKEKPESIILVSVGRFSSEKHMIDAVQVSQKLVQSGISNFKWHLVGDGPEKTQVESLIKEKNLSDYIILEGSQSNPYPYINDADIFVHPSYVESQGLAVLEAFVLGKLSVVVKSAGTNEFVHNGINAYQAEQNIDSLYDQVVRAILEPNKQRFEYQAYETAEQFAASNVIKDIYSLAEN